MSAQVEVWRVSTVEGVFETDLDTLRQWIVEGCVLPTDKVSKGSLNWIDAGRAPMLRAAFNGEVAPLSLSQADTNQMPPAADAMTALVEPVSIEPSDSATAASSVVPTSPRTDGAMPAEACHNHPDVAPQYLCRMCAAMFCKECQKFVTASNVPICPLCGDLCKPYQEIKTKTANREFQSSGFGLQDFARAIRYPFQHKIALFSGAAIYGLLQLAGFKGSVVAYVIMFGCISHVIGQVAWGRLNRSFMPDFSEFSLWDDFAVPLGLGIGITVVTWGPVIALVLALVFGVLSGAGPSPMSAQQMHAAQQSSAPKEEDLSILMDPEADPEKLKEANAKLNQLRPGAQISQEAERSKNEASDPMAGPSMLMPYLQVGIVIVLLFLLALAWAIFYYPMALTVAGYTQSFTAVINPLVGLDTIRRMGATYFKAFGMVLLLQFVGLILSVIILVVTSPLALPFFGNLPARFIDGSITFYFNLVIACLLGLSLYKCADRLDINVD